MQNFFKNPPLVSVNLISKTKQKQCTCFSMAKIYCWIPIKFSQRWPENENLIYSCGDVLFCKFRRERTNRKYQHSSDITLYTHMHVLHLNSKCSLKDHACALCLHVCVSRIPILIQKASTCISYGVQSKCKNVAG